MPPAACSARNMLNRSIVRQHQKPPARALPSATRHFEGAGSRRTACRKAAQCSRVLGEGKTLSAGGEKVSAGGAKAQRSQAVPRLPLRSGEGPNRQRRRPHAAAEMNAREGQK